jgi:penicillin-binding protein 1C
VRWRRWARRAGGLALCVVLALLAVRLWPHPPLSAGVPLSTAVLDREGRLLRLGLAADQRYRHWVALERMPDALVEGVLLHEDAWFRWHPGVNPVSLARGAWSTWGSGEARVGGSTITMQLARLRWRLETRDVPGKLVQIARALQLEAMYSKDEILEAYLNLAPYGGNLEGVGAASRIYFDKPVDALSLPEALALAVLPQAPTRRGRLRRGEGDDAWYLGDGLVAARARLYARWREAHPVPAGDEAAAADRAASDALMALPLRLRAPRQLPFHAPHYVDRVLAALPARPLPAGTDLSTTLDLRLQRLLERRLRQHLALARRRGIDNAAVMLVDTRDMAVRALIGSADWHDASIHGQVNGTNAKRSPGSTLKPFLYALGLDQGVLHPATVLRDVPSAFGPYTPENFDGGFMGPVTATEALVRSRNIPAVWVGAQLSNPSLHGLLREAGVRDLRSEQHYGLALVLGGGELTMEELARLYAMLGHAGRLRPLRWRDDDPADRGAQLISPEAAFITRDMLRQNPRPGGAYASDLATLPVAWKTGTSWGFRDAWTAGLVGPYALIVWQGHFDNRPNPALVGVEAAAPLFFELVDALRAAGVDLAEPPQPRPRRLARVEVCLASGDLPNAHCPARGETWFIPGVSPIRVSRVHREVAIDVATGRVACGPFDPATMRREVHEFWPSDLARVFAQAGMPRRRPPPGADCAGAQAWQGSPPRITSPWSGTRYARRLSRPDEPGIPLQATLDADVREVYWFAGDAFLGRAGSGEALAWVPPRAGRWRLRAVDALGRADEREVVVDVEP